MKKTNIEKFEEANLRNISNNLYSFLKNNNEKRININANFDFDEYKETVRYELIQFSNLFIYLVNHNSKSAKELASTKTELKNYVDEILDNEKMLDNFTIYKIQQFINRVARDLLKNNYETFVEKNKREKFIEYKDIEIDTSNLVGFLTADKVINYLYREFNLKRLNDEEYSEAFLLNNTDSIKENSDYVDKINKLLFKAATSIDNRKQRVISHPVKDDETIFRYIEEGFVADKTPKRILKRKINEEVEEILL